MKRVDSFHLLKERFGKWSKDPSPLFSADMFTPTYVGRRCVSASRRVVHKEYFFIGVRASGLKRKGVGGISSHLGFAKYQVCLSATPRYSPFSGSELGCLRFALQPLWALSAALPWVANILCPPPQSGSGVGR